MRFRGTGSHPQYPKGQVVDMAENDYSSASLISEGHIEAVPLMEDPGRTPSQIAASAQRGEFSVGSVSDPVEQVAAAKEGWTDSLGRPTADVFPMVHGDGTEFTDGSQPEEAGEFDSQFGANAQVMREAVANEEEERNNIGQEFVQQQQDASGTLVSPPPQESVDQQQAEQQTDEKAAAPKPAAKTTKS